MENFVGHNKATGLLPSIVSAVTMAAVEQDTRKLAPCPTYFDISLFQCIYWDNSNYLFLDYVFLEWNLANQVSN